MKVSKKALTQIIKEEIELFLELNPWHSKKNWKTVRTNSW